MLRIGLTGGIASGKSTVASMFAALGATVIDTDEIAHELVASGGAALPAVVEAFGPDVVGADGGLDRRRMRGIVFADPDRRRRLEAILHPSIRESAIARAKNAEGPYVIFVVPLLFETGFSELVDRALVVDCPVTLQIERLVERDGTTAPEAAKIVAAQMDRESRRARADDVIDSDCEIDAVRERVRDLHEQYSRLARNCPKAKGRAE